MQALKGLVVVLGILIVISFVLLGYGFYTRMTDPEFRILKTRDTEASPADRASRGFGEASLDLPEGCTLVEAYPNGQWLYLRTGPPGPCERIIIVDPSTGRVHGAIVARP